MDDIVVPPDFDYSHWYLFHDVNEIDLQEANLPSYIEDPPEDVILIQMLSDLGEPIGHIRNALSDRHNRRRTVLSELTMIRQMLEEDREALSVVVSKN